VIERILIALSWLNLVVLGLMLAFNVVGGWLPGH
jgi:hypothetical protein